MDPRSESRELLKRKVPMLGRRDGRFVIDALDQSWTAMWLEAGKLERFTFFSEGIICVFDISADPMTVAESGWHRFHVDVEGQMHTLSIQELHGAPASATWN